MSDETGTWDIEALAATVHQAYLDTCERLGWPVKPANQVPYADLAEDSKELDRASVKAVLNALEADLKAARESDDFARAELASVIREYGDFKNEMREERSRHYNDLKAAREELAKLRERKIHLDAMDAFMEVQLELEAARERAEENVLHRRAVVMTEQRVRPWHVGFDESNHEWYVLDPQGERHVITRDYLASGFDKWLQETLEEAEASWSEVATVGWNNDPRTKGLQANLLAAIKRSNALESDLARKDARIAELEEALREIIDIQDFLDDQRAAIDVVEIQDARATFVAKWGHNPAWPEDIARAALTSTGGQGEKPS